MWQNYYSVLSVDEAIQILADGGERARIVAGATDLIIELERGVREGIDSLVDVTRIPGLDRISMDEKGWIHLGPLITHNDCVVSKLIVEHAFPLAQAAWEVGAPQIRNRGTVAGNLITASPANDTITPLMAMGAQVTLKSIGGERVVPLKEFYTGVRGTVMQVGEMLVDIAFPALKPNQRGTFIKLGLRRAQAIAVVNAAVVLTFKNGDKGIDLHNAIESADITLGAVAPTIINASGAEMYLESRKLNDIIIAQTADLAMRASSPIDDIRSPADYRREMVRVCVSRGLHAIADGVERDSFPADPVLLVSQSSTGAWKLTSGIQHNRNTNIETRINGSEYVFGSGQGKTLLRLLREEAGLIGTKEGCAEGECGACTVFLDGKAVMSCLVPAVRAHKAEIVTVEGLAQDGKLHPVQKAYVEQGAVQCGYCTPGFIMSSVMLLDEKSQPSMEQIQYAHTGNLCRCTGYYKIIEAVERASQL